MTSLVSPADVKALVNTSLSTAALQAVIDRVEAQIIEKIGAPQDDAGSVTLEVTKPGEGALLFMPTAIGSIVSIVEDLVTLGSTEYQIWSGGVIERLPVDVGRWGRRNVVTYKPADDRLKRTQVIIDLVRLALERTALQSESVAGEYSFRAPDNWDAEFNRAMKRLTFQAV